MNDRRRCVAVYLFNFGGKLSSGSSAVKNKILTSHLHHGFYQDYKSSCFVSFSCTGIAKHFRYGSQEDAHEFLRYTVDAMQKSCLPGTK